MLKYRLPHVFLFALAIFINVNAADAAGLYDWSQCQGSARPYPVPETIAQYPDSLTPVMINHVGRHGARYASSPAHTSAVLKALDRADSLGTITPLGRELRLLVDSIVGISEGRWGQLDSLGMVEQQGIAQRMSEAYPELFRGQKVNARGSYVPRCVMSMYEFTHQLALHHPSTDIDASSGPRYIGLLRFFSENPAYEEVVRSAQMKSAIKRYSEKETPLGPLRRVLGENYPLGADRYDLALDEYQVLAGMEAIGLKSSADRFFTLEEYNQLWRVFNLRQYLVRSASRISRVPAEIARPLLDDLISTTDAFLEGDTAVAPVMLRFGHAETLMPLLSLMGIPGCDAPDVSIDEVARSWRDFDIVPMAANLQMVLLRAPSGVVYLRLMLNERPVALPGQPDLIPWSVAREILQSR